ncbi:MAG: hypothetical protein Q4G51_02695 [Dermatophilus congolensis]|nr:hypothetical protein [Dermatophilus congolensis]
MSDGSIIGAVLFEERTLMRVKGVRLGRFGAREPELQAGTEPLVRHLEENRLPFGVITERTEAQVADDLAGLCTFADTVVSTGGRDMALAREQWAAAAQALGVAPSQVVAVTFSEEAQWAAAAAGCRCVHPSEIDGLLAELRGDGAQPLTALWESLRRSADGAQRLRNVADAFLASGLRVTHDFLAHA